MQTHLDFRADLVIECLENTIGVEFGENGRPNKTSKIRIYIPCDKIKVKHHGRMWGPSKINIKSDTKISKGVLYELFKMW